MKTAIELPIPSSDGDEKVYPSPLSGFEPAFEVDTKAWLQKLSQEMRRVFEKEPRLLVTGASHERRYLELGDNAFFQRFPDGYKLFRDTHLKRSYKYLFGHPSGKKFPEFSKHLEWLLRRKYEQQLTCQCTLCELHSKEQDQVHLSIDSNPNPSDSSLSTSAILPKSPMNRYRQRMAERMRTEWAKNASTVEEMDIDAVRSTILPEATTPSNIQHLIPSNEAVVNRDINMQDIKTEPNAGFDEGATEDIFETVSWDHLSDYRVSQLVCGICSSKSISGWHRRRGNDTPLFCSKCVHILLSQALDASSGSTRLTTSRLVDISLNHEERTASPDDLANGKKRYALNEYLRRYSAASEVQIDHVMNETVCRSVESAPESTTIVENNVDNEHGANSAPETTHYIQIDDDSVSEDSLVKEMGNESSLFSSKSRASMLLSLNATNRRGSFDDVGSPPPPQVDSWMSFKPATTLFSQESRDPRKKNASRIASNLSASSGMNTLSIAANKDGLQAINERRDIDTSSVVHHQISHWNIKPDDFIGASMALDCILRQPGGSRAGVFKPDDIVWVSVILSHSDSSRKMNLRLSDSIIGIDMGSLRNTEVNWPAKVVAIYSSLDEIKGRDDEVLRIWDAPIAVNELDVDTVAISKYADNGYECDAFSRTEGLSLCEIELLEFPGYSIFMEAKFLKRKEMVPFPHSYIIPRSPMQRNLNSEIQFLTDARFDGMGFVLEKYIKGLQMVL